MPACLKCHESQELDITTVTQQKLQPLNPKDLVTDYKLKDFRRLWKIEFAKKQKTVLVFGFSLQALYIPVF